MVDQGVKSSELRPRGSRLHIARAVGLVAGRLRERWTAVVVFAFGLGYLPRLAISSARLALYLPGSHDLHIFALYATELFVVTLLDFLWQAAVTAAIILPVDRASPLEAARRVWASVATLTPVWLISSCKFWYVIWYIWTMSPSSSVEEIVRRSEFVLVVSATGVIASFVFIATVGVIVPVLVGERLGFVAGLRRSWTLMQGSRWKVAALYAVSLVVTYAVNSSESALESAVARTGMLRTIVDWVGGATEVSLNLAWTALIAASYLELRQARGGVPSEQVAEVFT
jgi:hypothetical protein